MANLRRYLAPSAHAGQKLKFYAGSLEVGEGTYERVENLVLVASGKAKVVGIELNGKVEVFMPDEAPKGRCTVFLTDPKGERKKHDCAYEVTGIRLDIQMPTLGWLGFQPEGRDVTWVRTQGGIVWISMRPASAAVPAEGFPEAPVGAGEPEPALPGD